MSKINEYFIPLYTSKKRYFLLSGGRGSLKSTTVHDFIARLTFQVGHGVLFTRYTMTSAEKSIIPEFKTTLERLGIEKYFDITQNIIRNNQTGSFIYFSGIKTSSGNQTANLKSIAGITTWVIEEGEDFIDEKAFDAIDDSIRVNGIQNRIIWIQNPSTREHFIYKRCLKDTSTVKNFYGYNVTISTHPSWEHIHTTYHIAEQLNYLNPEWLDKANEYRLKAEQKEAEEKGAKYKSHYYYNYIGGWLERAEGVIFDYTIGQFNESLPVKCFTLDWGYNPDPLALGQIAVDQRNKKIYVREKIYATMVNDVVSALANIGVKKHELIICDTSEPRTKQNISKLGFNIQNAIKGKIVDDVREIKQYEIILDPESSNFKMEFDNYIWNDKKASIPIDKYNHLIDGMRYGFRRLTSYQNLSQPVGSPQLF